LENSIELNNHINEEIDYLKHTISLYEFRVENPVEEEFLDEVLSSLEWNYIEHDKLINKSKLDVGEQETLKYLKKELTTGDYLVKNKINLKPGSNLRDSLMHAHEDYVFLLILFVIMISAGIFSEEFNKGTIKNLLTKPYNRIKVLFAKYITTLIAYLFILISLYTFVFIVNGIIFSFEGVTLPVLEYNYGTDKLLVLNVFKAIFINAIYITPFILFLSTFAFFLSLLIHSTAFATTVSFGAFIAGEIINVLVVVKNIEPLKYFITLNWDLSIYQYGATNPFGDLTFKFSLVIYLIYFISLILLSVIIFQKKDIKNI
jgi:ABC-2 type transport system permease protein